MKTLSAYWLIAVIASVWTATAYLVPPLGTAAFCVCIVCACLDMGMNGARYAEFAPVNLAGAALALLGSALGTA